jgi:Spy/CpxP family protein refolding chaperone
MKKILVLLFAVFLTSSLAQAKIPEDNMKNPTIRPKMTEQERIQREKAFEQRLGLTEEQIQKSKELRFEGREKIKPVIEEIRAKESAKELVRNSTLDVKKQEEKLNSLNADLKMLRKQAHDIRVENMKEFESILTVEQRKTLKEMKQEGRQEFNKHRMLPPPQKR